MNSSKEINSIISDIVGTIVLIVEDEGEFSHDIYDFIERNYNIFVKSNELDTSIDEIKKYDIESNISKRLLEEGYSVEINNGCISVKTN